MPTLEEDRAEILKLHKDWWEANQGTDIPLMASCFPSGMSYLMFNLNGHPYFGIDEKVELWHHYYKELVVPYFPDMEIMRLTISGDMAYIACEGLFPVGAIGASGTGSETWDLKNSEGDYDAFRIRVTEIYQRDDGDGNPVWKMWHYHASPLPDLDEQRPGLGGTPRERGLGRGPGIEPFRVTREGNWDNPA